MGIVSGCTRTFEHHGAVHKRSRGTSVKQLYAKSRGYSRLDFRISLCEAHSMSAGHAELKLSGTKRITGVRLTAAKQKRRAGVLRPRPDGTRNYLQSLQNGSEDTSNFT